MKGNSFHSFCEGRRRVKNSTTVHLKKKKTQKTVFYGALIVRLVNSAVGRSGQFLIAIWSAKQLLKKYHNLTAIYMGY